MTDIEKFLMFLPLAEELFFKIGSAIVRFNVRDLTKEQMVEALKAAESKNWKQFDFISTQVKNG